MKILWPTPCVAVAALLLTSGCGKPQQTHPGQWFQTATGLPFPTTATEVHAKAIVVFPVGDTYYLQLQTLPEFADLVPAEFSACNWSDAKQYLVPPVNWSKDLPFWDATAVREAEHAQRRHVDSGGTTWLSYLAYDRESGTCFFVGVQAGG